MLYFLVVAKFLQILIMMRVRTSKSALVVMLVISPLFCKMSSELQKRKKKVANIKDQSGSIAMLQMQFLRLQENLSMMVLSSLIKLTIDLSGNVGYVSTKK